jgi:hypothetical protein
MTETDNSRSIGNTPVTDAAAASVPDSATINTGSYSAAMAATGADINDDDADDRSDDAPENFNTEQDDEAAQAQTVADDAIRGIADRSSGSESEHGGSTNPAQIEPDDAQDVVDHMNQMERSGQIDMDAYRGERSDDDEPDTFGDAALEPDDVDSHGNRGGSGY